LVQAGVVVGAAALSISETVGYNTKSFVGLGFQGITVCWELETALSYVV
jgi:hypothetical protein